MEQDKKFKCEKCKKPFKLKSILLLHSMRCQKISLNSSLDKETDYNAKDLNLRTEKLGNTINGIEKKKYENMKGKYIIIQNDNSDV